MRYYKTIYAGFLLLLQMLVFIGCSGGDDATPNDTNSNPPQNSITFLLDVSYGEHPQEKYDVYLPANRNIVTTKTMVLIHGGCLLYTSPSPRD